MKKALRSMWIAALAAAVGFSVIACGNGGGNGPAYDMPTGVAVTAAGGSVMVPQGGTWQFSATVAPATASQIVDWTVTDTSGDAVTGVSINTAGLLNVGNAVEPGTVLRVRAAARPANAGISGYLDVTVSTEIPMPTAVEVRAAGGSTTVPQGHTWQFSATVEPAAANQSVGWTVTDTSGNAVTGVSINAAGLLDVGSAVALGTVLRVTATATPADAGISGYLDVTVSAEIPVDKDRLSEALSDAQSLLDGDINISADGMDVPANEYWVTQDDVDALQDARAAANVVYNDDDATQDDVDEATTELQAAIADFEDAILPGLMVPVDRTALSAALSESEDLFALIEAGEIAISDDGLDVPADEYWVTPEDAEALEDAHAAAYGVYSDDYATQDDVDEATEDLLAAIADFEDAILPGLGQNGNGGNGNDVDRTALNAAIAEAEAYEDAFWDDELDGLDPDLFWDLMNAAQAGREVRGNANATQAQVDNATQAIWDAIDAIDAYMYALDGGDPQVNRAALIAALAEASGIFVGIGMGSITVPPALEEALVTANANAIAARDNPNATQAEVDAAAQALENAILDIMAYLMGGGPGLNLTMLNAAIHDAEDTLFAYMEGELGAIPAGLIQALTNAQDDGIAVRDNPNATQPQVDAAAQAILDAIQDIEDYIMGGPQVDRTALNFALADASFIVMMMAGGLITAPPALEEAFDTAHANAIAVRDNPDATQAEVDTATQALEDAITDILTGVGPGGPDFTELDAAIAEAEDIELELDLGIIVIDDFLIELAFIMALEDARDVRTNPDAVQAEVTAATWDLNNAITAIRDYLAGGNGGEPGGLDLVAFNAARFEAMELDGELWDAGITLPAALEDEFYGAWGATTTVFLNIATATQEQVDAVTQDLVNAIAAVRAWLAEQ